MYVCVCVCVYECAGVFTRSLGKGLGTFGWIGGCQFLSVCSLTPPPHNPPSSHPTRCSGLCRLLIGLYLIRPSVSLDAGARLCHTHLLCNQAVSTQLLGSLCRCHSLCPVPSCVPWPPAPLAWSAPDLSVSTFALPAVFLLEHFPCLLGCPPPFPFLLQSPLWASLKHCLFLHPGSVVPQHTPSNYCISFSGLFFESMNVP